MFLRLLLRLRLLRALEGLSGALEEFLGVDKGELLDDWFPA